MSLNDTGQRKDHPQAKLEHQLDEPGNTLDSLVTDNSCQIPFKLFEPTQEIRPEYNIGKFAGKIFASPYAKNIKEIRKYQWQVADGDSSLDASLTITPLSGQKTPTTTTLRVFLALIQVWEHVGFPEDGIVRFSARQICPPSTARCSKWCANSFFWRRCSIEADISVEGQASSLVADTKKTGPLIFSTAIDALSTAF